MKHKHAELIKAWADGAIIEFRLMTGVGWTKWQEQHGGFIWYEDNAQYRIKSEPKPDKVWYAMAYLNESDYCLPVMHTTSKCQSKCDDSNVKFIFDGETGKLKSAEVIE